MDYIRVPVKDMKEAKRFYGEVLGLQENPNSACDDWIEYEVGNHGAGVNDPSGHPVLLHHRYAAYRDGTRP